MSWLVLASSSVLLFTALNLLQKVLATSSRNPRALSVVFNTYAALISAVIFLTTTPLSKISFPKEPAAWVFLLLAASAYALFERSRFSVAKLIDASVFSTITNVSVLVAFFGSVFLYNEPLTTSKLIGLVCIVSALVLLSYRKGSRASAYGILLAIAISAALGVGWMLDKFGAFYFNSATYNIMVWTLPIALILLPKVPIADLKYEIKTGSWKIVLLALLNVTGYFLQLQALTVGDATRVIPIVQTSTLFTVLAGIVLLKEKEDLPKKIIAGIIAVAGVALII